MTVVRVEAPELITHTEITMSHHSADTLVNVVKTKFVFLFFKIVKYKLLSLFFTFIYFFEAILILIKKFKKIKLILNS